MNLEPGTAVPAFELPDHEGNAVSLGDLAGSPAVLFFYPKADTSGCTTETGDFSRLEPEFVGAGTKVLGVSPDPVRKIAKFRDKYGFEVRLLSDEDKRLIEPLGLWVEKSMYGRKYMGVERTTLLLDGQGRIARVWAKVKVPGHAEEVLEAARQLSEAG